MIAIGAAERVEELRDRLATEFRVLEAEGLDIQVKTVQRGELTFVGCDIAGKKLASPEVSRRFRLMVANAVADLIAGRWEQGFLRKLIRTHYGYFDHPEQEAIYQVACQQLYGPAGEIPTQVARRGKVLARLTDYLEKNNELVVDGFVTFRLKDYVEELEEAVDTAVEDFLMEREHQEFIRLLRYFVEAQAPACPAVQVWPSANGVYRLMDATGRPIRGEEIECLADELKDREIDQEDLLVSALIALTPGDVTFHQPLPGEAWWQTALDTVAGIFGDRCHTCRTCPCCREAASAPRGRPGEDAGRDR